MYMNICVMLSPVRCTPITFIPTRSTLDIASALCIHMCIHMCMCVYIHAYVYVYTYVQEYICHVKPCEMHTHHFHTY